MGFFLLYFGLFARMWFPNLSAAAFSNSASSTPPLSYYLYLLVFHSAIRLPIFGVMAFVFLRRVWPYRKDFLFGMKRPVYYTIIRKSYFPITQQYFISFDDPAYMHHEVDAAWYDACREGGTACLYMAPFSKYIFEENGRFTII